jgi:hypothetical protein
MLIGKRETGRSASPPFRYFDKGNMAVIGRGFAILDSRFSLHLGGVTSCSPEKDHFR